jgi:hypothetical protein
MQWQPGRRRSLIRFDAVSSGLSPTSATVRLAARIRKIGCFGRKRKFTSELLNGRNRCIAELRDDPANGSNGSRSCANAALARQ